MKIKINQINIKNFKGIKELSFNFKDNTNIFGANGTGKTSIVDAFMWCLFGKDSQDRKDYMVKPQDENGEEIHNVETSVEIELSLDGIKRIFKKILKENWVKKRGNIEATYQGNTIDYYIDEVPSKQTEYKNKIAEIIDEDMLKLITNPIQFNTMHWTKQRDILNKISDSNTSDEDILSDEKYKELKLDMANHTVEDYKKVLVDRIKKTTQDIDDIPLRIDEVTKRKNELESINYEELENKKNELSKEIENINTQLSDISDNSIRLEITNQIAQLKNDKMQKQNEFLEEKNKYNTEILENKQRINNAKSEIKMTDSNILKSKEKIEGLKKEKEVLLKDYKELKAKEFTEDKIICSYTNKECSCIKGVTEELKNNFEEDKEKRIAILLKKGKLKKEEIENEEKGIETLTQIFETQNNHLQELEKLNVKEFDKELDTNSLDENIKVLELKLQSEINSNDNVELKNKLKEVENEKENIIKELAKKSIIADENNRIEELKKELNEKVEVHGSLQKMKCLLEEFIKDKVNKLEQSINNNFELVKFKLFKTNINGGLEECCITMVNGVEFGAVNTANKINAGLDIINTLCKYYDIQAPIFIDNRESVTKLIDTKSQIINLIVSENDKELRVE